MPRRRVTFRSGRDRAVILAIALALFLGVYLVLSLELSSPMWARLEAILPGLAMTMLGIGVTVLVTTFSFVFVALSLVSVQFSPRVVRQFWHNDGFRLFFLWAFIGIFSFLFVTLLFPVPGLQLLALFLSTYAVFALFPAFLSYLADNLNAASIAESIADRTLLEIAREHVPIKPAIAPKVGTVVAESSGFLENIDVERLLAVMPDLNARGVGTNLRVANYLGSFVEAGSMLTVTDPPVEITPALEREIIGSFALRKFRSMDQDVEYGVRQLVDIAIKAISPAVNDPTTCVNCIRYLGVIIKDLIARDLRSQRSRRVEEQGLILKEPSFEQFLDDAFDQIYFFGRHDPVIVRTLIGALTEIVSAASDAARAETVCREIEEMELLSLMIERDDHIFPLIESRNFVRRTLVKFYGAASERFTALGAPAQAADCDRLAAAIENSMERIRIVEEERLER